MNIIHMLQGRSDTSLNDRGRQQAREAGRVFKEKGITPDIIFSSPLTRVRQTVDEALGAQDLEALDMTYGEALAYQGRKIPRVTDKRLIEMSFGEVEGIPIDKLPRGFEKVFFETPSKYKPVPGAESYDELLSRGREFIEFLRKETREGAPMADKTVVCATHGGLLHGILNLLWHREIDDFWKSHVLNCAIIEARLGDSKEEDDALFVSDGYTGEE